MTFRAVSRIDARDRERGLVRVTVDGVDVSWKVLAADVERREAVCFKVVMATEQGAPFVYAYQKNMPLRRFEKVEAIYCPEPLKQDGMKAWFLITDDGMAVETISGEVKIWICG